MEPCSRGDGRDGIFRAGESEKRRRNWERASRRIAFNNIMEPVVYII